MEDEVHLPLFSGTLQLAVALLGVVMPKDFGRFK